MPYLSEHATKRHVAAMLNMLGRAIKQGSNIISIVEAIVCVAHKLSNENLRYIIDNVSWWGMTSDERWRLEEAFSVLSSRLQRHDVHCIVDNLMAESLDAQVRLLTALVNVQALDRADAERLAGLLNHKDKYIRYSVYGKIRESHAAGLLS